MNQQEWEDGIKKMMHKDGWRCDRDDETRLGFSYIEGEFHWIRDYCKKMRRFVQYNGNQKVNLKVTKKDD